MDDDELLDFTPLVPLAKLPPYFDEPQPPAPSPRRSSPVSATRPAYGLVGMPASTVTTKDAKVFALGASFGAAVAALFCWLARRHG